MRVVVGAYDLTIYHCPCDRSINRLRVLRANGCECDEIPAVFADPRKCFGQVQSGPICGKLILTEFSVAATNLAFDHQNEWICDARLDHQIKPPSFFLLPALSIIVRP